MIWLLFFFYKWSHFRVQLWSDSRWSGSNLRTKFQLRHIPVLNNSIRQQLTFICIGSHSLKRRKTLLTSPTFNISWKRTHVPHLFCTRCLWLSNEKFEMHLTTKQFWNAESGTRKSWSKRERDASRRGINWSETVRQHAHCVNVMMERKKPYESAYPPFWGTSVEKNVLTGSSFKHLGIR